MLAPQRSSLGARFVDTNLHSKLLRSSPCTTDVVKSVLMYSSCSSFCCPVSLCKNSLFNSCRHRHCEQRCSQGQAATLFVEVFASFISSTFANGCTASRGIGISSVHFACPASESLTSDPPSHSLYTFGIPFLACLYLLEARCKTRMYRTRHAKPAKSQKRGRPLRALQHAKQPSSSGPETEGAAPEVRQATGRKLAPGDPRCTSTKTSSFAFV